MTLCKHLLFLHADIFALQTQFGTFYEGEDYFTVNHPVISCLQSFTHGKPISRVLTWLQWNTGICNSRWHLFCSYVITCLELGFTNMPESSGAGFNLFQMMKLPSPFCSDDSSLFEPSWSSSWSAAFIIIHNESQTFQEPAEWLSSTNGHLMASPACCLWPH